MHYNLIWQVVHVKGSRVRSFRIETPIKTVVKSLKYHKPSYTARSLLQVDCLRSAVIGQVVKVSI